MRGHFCSAWGRGASTAATCWPGWLFLLLLAIPMGAQGQEGADLEMTNRIIQEGLENSRAPELYAHLTDAIGPRLAGTPAYQAATRWAMDQLVDWGLDNVHTEGFPFGRGWTLEGLTLEMTGPRYFPLHGYPEAWTPPTDGMLEGRPVYIGDKTVEELEAMRAELNGAIVLISPPQYEFITEDRLQPAAEAERVPIGAPRSPRVRAAAGGRDMSRILQEAGAGLTLRPNAGQHGTLFVLGSRGTPDEAIPSIVMASEHYNMLVRMVEAGVDVEVRARIESRYHGGADEETHNVIAEIPGSDPAVADEIVLIGGHLDSWHSSPGGSDNADGVASTMEAMRILKALGVRPRRTIRMALWGAEEEGLLGSRAYVEQHLTGEENAANRENFYVYFNNDPGYGKILGWYLEENAAVKPIFDAWLEPLREVGAMKNVMDAMGSTDHVPFVRAELPGFNAIQDYRDYDTRTHHTNQDFFERVAQEDLKQAAIVLATFAYHAAMREGELPGGD